MSKEEEVAIQQYNELFKGFSRALIECVYIRPHSYASLSFFSNEQGFRTKKQT